jgi:hypothetical protein
MPQPSKKGYHGMREIDSTEFAIHVRRLLRLEQLLGMSTKYQMLDPFSFSAADRADTQRAASRIRDFLGLQNVTFDVRPAPQDDNVAGRIDLKEESRMIFIEVAPDTAVSERRLLATIAHEITHYFLNTHGLPPQSSHEYEVFTDTAAVFLGLGKLLLNGCDVSDTSFGRDGRRTDLTYHTGYLAVEELALVYHVVCTMRGIQNREADRALSPRALAVVHEIRSVYDALSGLIGGEPDPRITQTLARQVDELQIVLCDLQSAIAYLRSSVHRHAEQIATQGHREAALLSGEARRVEAEEFDPGLRHLRLLEKQSARGERLRRLRTLLTDAHKALDETMMLVQTVVEKCSSFPEPRDDDFTHVSCGQCGTILRLPASAERRKACCPNCRYEFYATTAAPSVVRESRKRGTSILGLDFII